MQGLTTRDLAFAAAALGLEARDLPVIALAVQRRTHPAAAQTSAENSQDVLRS